MENNEGKNDTLTVDKSKSEFISDKQKLVNNHLNPYRKMSKISCERFQTCVCRPSPIMHLKFH